MNKHLATDRNDPFRPLAQPTVLTLAETKRVSGGGANYQNGDPAGGNPAYPRKPHPQFIA
jgi:hypothetical protein